ncbi:LPS export ABC transporter ATP-binding protein [Erythrobacter insulae]|uniref:LPS export ABC transporter ATP-binding protein n=1 Tax=Erythrobacter insulae TaxID=2584124 RepID=UPI001F3F4122|nr:LPS export ABC transporter ATP-binding protein [Erythrobacter insulae]
MEDKVAAALELIDVHKSFGQQPVLNGLSMQVSEGEIVGLFGRDGAGKTIAFYCILGLMKPTSGRVVWRGDDITRLPFYRRAILGLGYLPEQSSIFRGMTVAQNIEVMLETVEPDPVRRSERLERLLADLRIAHLRDASAKSLSGGERRRCEVARALALEPAIMILDEPFAGIDPLTIASIKEMILSMKARGIGVLLTDQNVREMTAIIDRAYVIDAGTTIFSGTPSAMLRDDAVIAHYLGRKDD